MESADEIRIERNGYVLTVTLNRPQRKNAFTQTMLAAWAEGLAEARDDDRVRAVVITGAGSAFCSGVDLDVFVAVGDSLAARRAFLTDVVHPVARGIYGLDKPVIACVNGPAYGAGMDMALLCDIRLASRSAVFAESYINIGLLPGDGGAWLLPRIVGTGEALEILLTGDPIRADKALALGVVNHVYDDDAVLGEAHRLAAKIAAKSPLATRAIKRAVRQFAGTDLVTSLDIIASHMAVIQSTADHAEAIAAFRERREPRFMGSSGLI